MADAAAMIHLGFAPEAIAKKRIRRLHFTTGFAAVCFFTFAIDQSAIAQPEGVLGYEAIDVGGSADHLDEFARVVDRRTPDLVGAAAWINGEWTRFDPPIGFRFVAAFDISPTSGVVVGVADNIDADQPIA